MSGQNKEPNRAGLNTEEPSVMWIDLNSAFATAEQQAHPTLRGRPLGVTNRISRECCIIAASYEAKRRGVKVGCRRSEALQICPELILLETDPPKYHYVYEQLFRIMKSYTPRAEMKSIDEGVLHFDHLPEAGRQQELVRIGYEIKARVRQEIGEYMMINVGIGCNRFQAKLAAGLHKPDGLDVISHRNLRQVLAGLELEDLTGIAQAFAGRLRRYGIKTPLDFLEASEETLKRSVFRSICGSYWYQRLRGFEIDVYKTKLGMVGRQWVVQSATDDEDYLRSCLHYLVETVGIKLRYREREARGVCVWLGFGRSIGPGGFSGTSRADFDGSSKFRARQMYSTPVYATEDIWQRVLPLFEQRPRGARVRIMGVYVYQLEPSRQAQTSLFAAAERCRQLTTAVDGLNDRYGTLTVHSADALIGRQLIKQKIPFGGTDYFNLLLKRA